MQHFERCNAVPMHNIPLWLSESDENCINNRYKYFEMVQIDLQPHAMPHLIENKSRISKCEHISSPLIEIDFSHQFDSRII